MPFFDPSEKGGGMVALAVKSDDFFEHLWRESRLARRPGAQAYWRAIHTKAAERRRELGLAAGMTSGGKL